MKFSILKKNIVKKRNETKRKEKKVNPTPPKRREGRRGEEGFIRCGEEGRKKKRVEIKEEVCRYYFFFLVNIICPDKYVLILVINCSLFKKKPPDRSIINM